MKRVLKMLLLVFFLIIIYVYTLLIESIPNELVIFEGENISMKTLLGVTIKDKNNQTINGDNFKFSKEWLTSVESKGYTANFSDYVSSGEYKYPTKISIKDGNSQIIYTFSSFK